MVLIRILLMVYVYNNVLAKRGFSSGETSLQMISLAIKGQR